MNSLNHPKRTENTKKYLPFTRVTMQLTQINPAMFYIVLILKSPAIINYVLLPMVTKRENGLSFTAVTLLL